MNQYQYSYSLLIRNIEKKDAQKLIQLMKQKSVFDGLLTSRYTTADAAKKQIYFDCGGSGGSISEIGRDDVKNTMHNIALLFPDAKFHLLAENVQDRSEAYQICTFGDMYQYAEQETHMSDMSKPVPFDMRAIAESAIGAKDYLFDFFHSTDFNLLYQQKQALLHAMEHQTPVPDKTLEGLVNFLDYIGDWAEEKGVFTYPDLEQENTTPQKPALDQLIASASDRTSAPAHSQKQDLEIT